MSVCEINFNFNGSPAGVFSELSSALTFAGGSVNGDEQKGTFELGTPVGKIAGNYSIDAEQIRIGIEKKPLFLSCAKIKSVLHEKMSHIISDLP